MLLVASSMRPPGRLFDSGTGVIFKWFGSKEDSIVSTRSVFPDDHSSTNKVKIASLISVIVCVCVCRCVCRLHYVAALIIETDACACHLVQVRTSVLVTVRELKAVAYGGTAHRKYLDMEPTEQANHLLFENFKMCLQRAHVEGVSLTVDAVNGVKAPALKVCQRFSDVSTFTTPLQWRMFVLCYILFRVNVKRADLCGSVGLHSGAVDACFERRDPASHHLGGSAMGSHHTGTHVYSMCESLFCFLTENASDLLNLVCKCVCNARFHESTNPRIPSQAIWSDSAKNFMRLSATLAGLCAAERPEQLLLALEPEAAALACHADMRNQRTSLPAGSKYILLDAGGGTRISLLLLMMLLLMLLLLLLLVVAVVLLCLL
jgi:hypothetical protein